MRFITDGGRSNNSACQYHCLYYDRWVSLCVSLQMGDVQTIQHVNSIVCIMTGGFLDAFRH